ncbi:MAG: hypothetical protein V4858_17325 [Pseudomonadota bacterium]
MSKFFRFVFLWLGRALMPFSFLIACIIEPWTMIRGLGELPRTLRAIWDDPL